MPQYPLSLYKLFPILLGYIDRKERERERERERETEREIAS
jgi:hypothetical protein